MTKKELNVKELLGGIGADIKYTAYANDQYGLRIETDLMEDDIQIFLSDFNKTECDYIMVTPDELKELCERLILFSNILKTKTHDTK
jgi:hypothetical protein